MDTEKLNSIEITELLLTAEVYNRTAILNESDLPPRFRDHYDSAEKGVARPMRVTIRDVEAIYGADNIKEIMSELPFVKLDGSDGAIRLSTFENGAMWYANLKDSFERIMLNPALAHYYQKYDPTVSYIEAKVACHPPTETDNIDMWLWNRLEGICSSEQEIEELMKLVTIKIPDRVKNRLDDLVLTEEQRSEIAKACKALEYRQYLKDIGLFEIGKILFVGPPGTGKTSVARSLARWFSMPLVEAKLSMLISFYLGQTSQNVDKIFMLAKWLNPCILFIDEFDFVAKARVTEDHGAMKRAVNTLLKAIDDMSLIEDGVLLIAATNHPQLLDHAAWRRFDKVLSFPLPDAKIRRSILDKVLEKVDAHVDTAELAGLTDGCSGGDLRLLVREAVLNALLEDRKKLDQQDMLRAVEELRRRNIELRQNNDI